MILIVCERCALCVRVMGNPEEIDHLVGERSDYWPDNYTCPSCDRGDCVFAVKELDAETGVLAAMQQVIDLTPQEAFAALNGLGFPSEQCCTQQVLTSLLREQPIRHVRGRDVVGANRFILESLELWDGTRLYFAAGAEGAVIYRVVPPQSYAEKADGR